MKNFIYIKYGIKIDKIYSLNNENYFFYKDNKYYIVEYYDSLNRLHHLFQLTNRLYNDNIFVNSFILNKENYYYSLKDEHYIVLLKENSYVDKIEFRDISKFFHINSELDNNNLLEDWEKEVDILETEMLQYNEEFQPIQLSFNFFVGCAENAIQLLRKKEHEIINNNDSIGHKGGFLSVKPNSINNPFIFIKVNKVYDIANYLKYKVFNNEIDYEELEYIFYKINLNNYEKHLLFCCLLYPSNYFYLVKKIQLGNEKEEKIFSYIKYIKKHILFLKYCQSLLIDNELVQCINWINDY